MKLLGHPTHDPSKLFWDGACFSACHLFTHSTIAIPFNELYWDIEVQQTCERFARHRAWEHIAPDYYVVYFGLTNILEDSLQCRQVPVNIVDCSYPDHIFDSIERTA